MYSVVNGVDQYHWNGTVCIQLLIVLINNIKTEYIQFHPISGSKRSQLHKNTTADIRLRTPDDGQKGCPKHVES